MSSLHFKPESAALVLIDKQVGTIQLVGNIMLDTLFATPRRSIRRRRLRDADRDDFQSR
jgi:hypothetical protein